MFEFIKKVFSTTIMFFSWSVLKLNPLECVTMDNQECKIRTKIIFINGNKLLFYPCSITVNKCSGSCNSINDPYAKL